MHLPIVTLRAKKGRISDLERLLASGADVNYRTTEQGATPLMLAATGGQKKLLNILLSRQTEKSK